MAPTDKDVYIKRFSELERGAPLYQPCEVHVGDVGFIDAQDGFFQKLYNIASPPTNQRRYYYQAPGQPQFDQLQLEPGPLVYPSGPPPIKLETTTRTEQWDAIHVCYLSYFILRTLSDFVIILAEEIKGYRSLIASYHVGQPVVVHQPITETRSSAPKVRVKCNLYSQKSKMVNAS